MIGDGHFLTALFLETTTLKLKKSVPFENWLKIAEEIIKIKHNTINRHIDFLKFSYASKM